MDRFFNHNHINTAIQLCRQDPPLATELTVLYTVFDPTSEIWAAVIDRSALRCRLVFHSMVIYCIALHRDTPSGPVPQWVSDILLDSRQGSNAWPSRYWQSWVNDPKCPSPMDELKILLVTFRAMGWTAPYHNHPIPLYLRLSVAWMYRKPKRPRRPVACLR